MKKPEVSAISLFAGCGGLDIGSHMAGAPVVAALDFEEDAIRTLQMNSRYFKNVDLHHADICTFDVRKFKDRLAKNKPGPFIVIGGPPCQPFSKNGYWVGNDKRQAHNDPRNMVPQFFRVVKELNPDGFLMENVDSLMHPSNAEAVKAIQRHIAELGYEHTMVRVNALEFGVPQIRKRVFFLGSRKPFNERQPQRTHCNPDELQLGETNNRLKPYEGVGRFIEKFSSEKYFEPQEVAKGGTYYEDLLAVPPGKNYIEIVRRGNTKFRIGKRFWNFLLKLHPDKPSWTIPAQPGPWVGPFHWSSRRLRVPELASIQTFPDGYKFFGSRRSIQRQLGNAVPCQLGKVMVEFLISNL